MIKFWDIRTGTAVKTLTQHNKGIRALVSHKDENCFASAGSDKIRVWKCPEGEQLRTITSQINEKSNNVINAMALNLDNVLVGGSDDGYLQFFDWKSGECFQRIKSPV